MSRAPFAAALLLAAMVALAPRAEAESVHDAAAYLHSPNVDDRHDAAEELRDLAREQRIPPVLAPDIAAALGAQLGVEQDEDVREHLLEALGALGGMTAVEVLVAHLGHEPDPERRHDVMRALAETGDPTAEPILRQYLQTAIYDEQHERAALYQRHAERSGRFGDDPDFPRHWPYGTNGFPEPAHGGTVWIDGAAAPPKFTVKGEIGAALRILHDTPILALELDTMIGGRTRSGIWGARFGTLQGSTLSGLGVDQYHVGPSWEAPTEFVRPSLQLRLAYLHIRRNTSRGEPIETLSLGGRLGLAFDLYRDPLDHAFHLSVAGVVDTWFDDLIAGGTLALGGRY